MDDPVLKAVQNFMDAVEGRISSSETELRGLATEVRGLLTELQTRSSEIPKEGPPGKDGINGKDGRDGIDGKPGEPGARGADGIGTREALDEWFEQRIAEVQTRNLADYHKRTFVNGTSYKRGDLTVWDGTTWLAMADTTAVPGTSPDWQQFAKKGRDGRDRK